MPGLTFDTHESVKSLKAAGFNEGQAEALMAEFKKVQESSIADLTTKGDLKDVRQELKGDINSVRQELKSDINSVRQEVKQLEIKLTGEITLVKWMLGFMLAGILSLVMKAFFVP